MSDFDHERRDAHERAVDVARVVAAARVARSDADLQDLAARSGRSVVLNLAAGRVHGGGAASHEDRIAPGSAEETCAALDLAPCPPWAARGAAARTPGPPTATGVATRTTPSSPRRPRPPRST